MHDRAASTGLALLLWIAAGAAVADDRDLLRESSGEPYVFILFDTSGSMHWTPQVPPGELQQRCESTIEQPPGWPHVSATS